MTDIIVNRGCNNNNYQLLNAYQGPRDTVLDAGDLFKNNDGAAYYVPGPLLVTRGYNEIKQPFIERTLPPRIVPSALQLIPYPMTKISMAEKESGAQKHLFQVTLQEVGILGFTPVPNLLFWGISVSLEGLQRTGTTQLSLPRVPTQRRLSVFTQTQRQQEEQGVGQGWLGHCGRQRSGKEPGHQELVRPAPRPSPW